MCGCGEGIHRDLATESKTIEEKLNHSELTFFIYIMLGLIREAQLGVIERLEEGINALEREAMEACEISSQKWMSNALVKLQREGVIKKLGTSKDARYRTLKAS